MANLNLGKTKIISDKNNTFFTNNKIMTGTKIPTTGEYIKGDMIVNIGPTSSTEPIWICNVSGSPGVWSVLGIGTVGGGGGETTIVSADVVCIQDIVTVNSAVTEVSLEGLGVVITPNDKLLVHFNSVYLMEGVDYNIDYASNKITVIGDVPWNESSIENSVFSLELFKNVEDTDGAVIQARFENNQNIVRLQESTNEIEIGIDGFDKNNNLLLVFKNTLHIAEGKDYSISDDSSKIVNLSPDDWAWNAGDEFVFIILRVVPNIDMPAGSINGGSLVDGSISIDKLGEDVQEAIRNAAESGSKLASVQNTFVLDMNASEIEIGIAGFNKSTDTLLVFKNSVHMAEGIEYTINDNNIAINKIEGEWLSGDSFVFLAFSNVMSEEDLNKIDLSGYQPINDDALMTENKTISGAINEVFVVASSNSVDEDEIRRIINEEIESLKKEIETLKSTQEQMIYVLEMKGITVTVVDGYWYDMLFDTTKMAYNNNIRVVDNNIVVINPLNPAEVKYEEVMVGFLASKLTYSHELDMQYEEVIAVSSEDNSVTIKNYSYDFSIGTEEVSYNAE